MEFVSWVENSALGIYMLDSIWAYPVILSAHAIGMSVVVGTMVMIDLRLLGFAAGAPLSVFRKLFVVTLLGVIVNFLSGVALFCSDPAQFLYHPVFLTKIGLMISGVVTAYFIWREINALTHSATEMVSPTTRVKILAALSLLLWGSVIVAGRLIAYVELG